MCKIYIWFTHNLDPYFLGLKYPQTVSLEKLVKKGPKSKAIIAGMVWWSPNYLRWWGYGKVFWMGNRMCWGSQVVPYRYVGPISKIKAQGHRYLQGLIWLEATPRGDLQFQGKCTPASEKSNRHNQTTKYQGEEYIALW